MEIILTKRRRRSSATVQTRLENAQLLVDRMELGLVTVEMRPSESFADGSFTSFVFIPPLCRITPKPPGLSARRLKPARSKAMN